MNGFISYTCFLCTPVKEKILYEYYMNLINSVLQCTVQYVLLNNVPPHSEIIRLIILFGHYGYAYIVKLISSDSVNIFHLVFKNSFHSHTACFSERRGNVHSISQYIY